ncbi:MAG: ATP-binding protein [Gemmatimonadota bacterium]|nr:ATP-binding protein [Gemmatimonadota bacterium]
MRDMGTSADGVRATEPLRTEDARRGVAQDFRALFDAAPGLYLVLAADPPRFTVVAANDERLVATMSIREGTLGRGLFDVFSDANPENASRTGVANLRASLETVLRTRAPDRMEVQRYDLARPDGTWEVRYWKQTNAPVLGPAGEVVYIIHHVEDVTGEVIAEARSLADEMERANLVDQLTAERARLRAVLRQLPVGVIIADAPSGKLVLGNDQLARIWWRSFSTPADVAEYAKRRGFHRDDGRPYTPEEWPLARAVAGGETVRGEEIDFLRGDGTRGTLSVAAAPIRDPDGRVIAGVAVFEDVTERKLAEADRAFLLDLAAALQQPPDAPAITAEATRRLGKYLGCLGCVFSDVDAKKGILHVRPGYVRAGGVSPGAEYPLPFLGRDWEKAMRAGDPYVVADAAMDPRTSGEAYDRYHAPVGTRSFVIVPLLRAGRWQATLGAWHDHPHDWTERELTLVREVAARVWPALENAHLVADARAARAEAEERARELEVSNLELVRLAAEAEAANRAKSDFLAVMSHELRTPLNAILGYIQIVGMGIHGPVTDAQREALDKCIQNQGRLLSLITDILDYAKLESGQLRLTAKNVTARVVLDGVETAILPQAHAKGIAYECRPGCETVTMSADPERAQQILLNLLSNAIKFTDPGGSIQVRCETLNRRVAIQVRDTGRGIPPDKLETIFEPFVQVDARLTRTQEGVGLGLAISRDLARGMGGDLTVESAEGAGSVFTLLLPRAS